MENQRNMILAVILTGLILFGWDAGMKHFYPDAHKAKPDITAGATASATAAASGAKPGKPTREGGLTDAAAIALEASELKADLNSPARVKIAAAGVSGSINLHGAVLDDLTLNRHTDKLDPKSGPVRLFSPAGTPAQHFAQFGWVGDNAVLPNADSLWTAPAGAVLSEKSPVTLTWTNPAQQTFTITYAIDKDYMITARQSVGNLGAAPLTVRPFALINRTNRTASLDSMNVHSGPFGAFDEAVSFDPDYDDLAEAGEMRGEGKTNWIGFTDIYWMSVLIPDASSAASHFRSLGQQLYRADLIYPSATVAPGQALSHETRLFAGAKESEVLDRYADQGVVGFNYAIDWGWFKWFEKPIFMLLMALFRTVGNFGVAIILLTVIVRGVMFPIANKQFSSMAAMKAIQPKMKAIQERYKDDKQQQQQEIMALYKSEGVNPLAGCLPIFLQIPVFFALYKVLQLAIEMRHQSFVLWIKDLSAPDPLHFLNLFGLLPFTPPSFLGLGVLALLLGITMWFQFRLNPAQMDPVQEQMFKIMPWMMMFIMAPFAAGLLIYWITSNVLTIAQQKYLYSKHPALKAQAQKAK